MTEPQPASSRVSVGGTTVERGTIRIVARFALGWAALGFVAVLAFALFGLPGLGDTVELDLPGRGPDSDFPVDAVGLTVVGIAVTAAALLAAIAAVLLSASAPGFAYVSAAVICIVIPGFVVITAGNGVAELLRDDGSGGSLATPILSVVAMALGAFSIFGAMRLAGDQDSLR
jgi:hypothetical protein